MGRARVGEADEDGRSCQSFLMVRLRVSAWCRLGGLRSAADWQAAQRRRHPPPWVEHASAWATDATRSRSTRRPSDGRVSARGRSCASGPPEGRHPSEWCPSGLVKGDALDRKPASKRMGFPSGDGLATVRDTEGTGTIAGWQRTPPSTSPTSDRYVEEHGIAEEDWPAAFALWIGEVTDRLVPRFEKVEREPPADGIVIEGDDLQSGVPLHAWAKAARWVRLWREARRLRPNARPPADPAGTRGARREEEQG